VTVTKYSCEGKVKLVAFLTIRGSRYKGRSLQAQTATYLPALRPNPTGDRHKAIVVDATGREGRRSGTWLLAAVRGNEHAWDLEGNAAQGAELLPVSRVESVDQGIKVDQACTVKLNHQYCSPRQSQETHVDSSSRCSKIAELGEDFDVVGKFPAVSFRSIRSSIVQGVSVREAVDESSLRLTLAVSKFEWQEETASSEC
jgi:hypothetical protein